MHLWSERPGARIRQIVADIATLTWVAIWISISVGLYRFLAQLAGAGRFNSDCGNGLNGIGGRLAGALAGVPLPPPSRSTPRPRGRGPTRTHCGALPACRR